MKFSKESLTLYAITDRTWLKGESLTAKVKSALEGGITCLQVREKDMSYSDFLAEAKAMVALAQAYQVPVIINDRVDIALASGADGVHVGQSDGDIAVIRKALGPEKILGVSVQTVAEAIVAKEKGADYLGVGAMLPTATKTEAVIVTKEECKAIATAVAMPIVLIGGLNRDTIGAFKGLGAHGAAVVSAIFAENNSCQTARELLELCREVFYNENSVNHCRL